ncbi:MAG: hypothetical protein M5U28_43775 [Sandaracinaceae bacterium]|nr:hypothetical protein [Sandaracinaceae bacterium]
MSEEIPLTIRASSDSGPVALAVARGDEVRCDSDEGAGHSPELSFTGPGDYLVYVAALRAPAELPYTLAVASGGAAGEAPAAVSGARDVSVTITSQPSGATVRDADGRVVGTTPAMFVVSLPRRSPLRGAQLGARPRGAPQRDRERHRGRRRARPARTAPRGRAHGRERERDRAAAHPRLPDGLARGGRERVLPDQRRGGRRRSAPHFRG